MRLGIIQLSDIHFRNSEMAYTSASNIAKQICSAVATELIGTHQVVLIVSGDIAYSGTSLEYQIASDWFRELSALLNKSCQTTCTFLYAPGNHDVDHTNGRQTRTALVHQIQTEPQFGICQEIIEECTKEQENFFAFRDELECSDGLVYDDPLLRIHRMHYGQDTIQINLFNTAWMSAVKEKQGTLIYPIEKYNLITSQAKRNLSSRSGIGGVLNAT